jgi:TolB-like protein/tetratricopeptide (TPR) repeat protein
MSPARNHFAAEPVPVLRVRSELDRIANSEAFQRSPQLQRFLRYIVEETLSGRGDRLKEYVIGTEVFGRPADYDPQLDSLVRVEAHRLRAALEQYYQQAGPGDSIRIELNKGSYVPFFREQLDSAELQPSHIAPQLKRYRWLAAIVAAGLVTAIAASAWLYHRQRSQRELLPIDARIAVLPFDNLSPEPGSEYFCFGLEDEITSELAKSGKLRVIARTSASRFKRGDDVPTIGRQLKADAVFEGSVQRSADRVRVTAELISVADNLHIWSNIYDRPSSNLFAVQDEVAQAVTSAVQLHITGATGKEQRQIIYSSNPQANQLYWKGVFFRAPMGRTGWRRDLATSAEFLERAVEKDPQFAQAYAVMADVYVSMAWERGGGPTTQGYMTRGRKAALRALELQDNLGEAYGALGTVQFFYDYDKAAAEKSFQRAMQLDPSNGKARMWYAMALTMQGRAKEAIAQAVEAKELDALSYVPTTHLAVVNYFSRNNDEAMRLVRETLAIADIAPAHGLLGMAYEVQHNYDAAIAEYQAGLRLVPKHSYIKGMLGHAYALSGRRAEALRLTQDTKLPFEEGGLSDLKVSYIYIGLGDYDIALRHLERDLQQRDPELPYINADPVFDLVRNDPRFIAILRAMGLAQ